MTIINIIVERLTSGDKLEKLQTKAWYYYLVLHTQNWSYFDSDYL